MEFEIRNSVLTKYNGKAARVAVPDGLYSIGMGAFAGCTFIKTVTLPEGIAYIGRQAFAGCSRLEHIVIPESVTYISDGAFTGCTYLHNIQMHEGDVRYLRNYKACGDIAAAVQDVWRMHRTGDYSGLRRLPCEFPALIPDYIQTRDPALAAMIKANLDEVMINHIVNGLSALIAALTESEQFFDQSNIDRYMEMAREQEQREIFMLLVNYKNAHIGFSETTFKL